MKPKGLGRQGHFLLWSALLALSGVWAVYDDFNPEYKRFQKRHQQVMLERARTELENENARVEQTYRETLEDLDRRIQFAAASQNSLNQAQLIEAKRAEVERLAEEERVSSQNVSFAKSEWGAARSSYEFIRNDSHATERDVAAAKARYDETFAAVLELTPAADAAYQALETARQELKDMESGPAELIRRREVLFTDRTAWREEVEKIRPSDLMRFVANQVRDAPLADWVDPRFNLHQIVMPDYTDLTGSAKVDRCITCHLNIENPAFSDADFRGEDAAFNAHPNLDLYVGRNSPHPVEKFGCTSCHLGRGYGSTFTLAAHTPNDERQEKQWRDDYGWKDMHYWDYPMLPKRNMQAMCFSCHKPTVGYELTMARDIFEGRQIYERRGCHGCHKIEGVSEDMTKIGPSLRMMESKLDPNWVPKWIAAPREFYDSARMPHPFGHTIPSRETFPEMVHEVEAKYGEGFFDADRENMVEEETAIVDSIAAYLFDNSRPMPDMIEPPAEPGDVERGRAIVSVVNCLGCHSLHETGRPDAIDIAGNGFAPDLSKIGSKTNRKWLYNWLLDPKKYWPDGNMPDPRLEPDEANDVVAYLMTLRDDAYMSAPAPAADEATLRELAMRYKRATMSESAAAAQIDAMSLQERKLYVGAEAVDRFGCFGCHSLNDDFDARPKIGAELTAEGFKEIELFDFGVKKFVHIPHFRHDWIRQKVLQPQIYMLGKVLNPYEKTPQMPWFGFTEEEADKITTFILGQTGKPAPPDYRYDPRGEKAVMLAGWKLMERRNCIGCHKLGLGERHLERTQLAELSNRFPSDVVWVSDPVVAKHDPNLPEGRYAEVAQVKPDRIVALEDGADFVLLGEDDFIAGDFEFGGGPYYVTMRELLTQPEVMTDVGLGAEIPVALQRPKLLKVFGVGEGAIGRMYGDAAMAPPVLRREGAKVRSEWLVDFLKNISTVRNHIEVRMPQWEWTQEEAVTVARALAHMAEDPFPWPDEDIAPFSEVHQTVIDRVIGVPTPPSFAEGTGACFNCHPAGNLTPTNDRSQWGPNLFLARDRLRLDFIDSWMRDPLAWDPNTRMTNFFYKRELQVYSEEKVLGLVVDELGGTDATIGLLAETLYHLPQSVDLIRKLDEEAARRNLPAAPDATPTPTPGPQVNERR